MKDNTKTKGLKVLYVAGPGDIISTYGFWVKGEEDPSESNITYSGQFFSVCKKLDIHAHIVSTNRDKKIIKDNDFIIEHRPNLLDKKGGVLFHFGQIKYGVIIILTAIKYKADYVLVSSGTHWFLLWPLSLLNIKIIPTIHCVLWPKYQPRKFISKCIDYFNGLFFNYGCYEIMSASKEITRQLSKSGVNKGKIHEFLPYYQEAGFTDIKPPLSVRRPFQLLYIGRIEKVKGVFDLLKIYNFLTKKGLDLELDYCGSGSSLEELRSLTKDNISIRCHGHCNKSQLLSILEDSHIIIVPTTTGFVEGFNQVVVESVLSGRPVVTSDVCPAIEYVLPAVVESEPDNIMSYAENIEKLYVDEEFYQLKRDACSMLQKQFYDEKNSWGNILEKILEQEDVR
jgi:glycosyltransferase involved in cell wall biosynthesis